MSFNCPARDPKKNRIGKRYLRALQKAADKVERMNRHHERYSEPGLALKAMRRADRAKSRFWPKWQVTNRPEGTAQDVMRNLGMPLK